MSTSESATTVSLSHLVPSTDSTTLHNKDLSMLLIFCVFLGAMFQSVVFMTLMWLDHNLIILLIIGLDVGLVLSMSRRVVDVAKKLK